jgi:hypothetical protein
MKWDEGDVETTMARCGGRAAAATKTSKQANKQTEQI